LEKTNAGKKRRLKNMKDDFLNTVSSVIFAVHLTIYCVSNSISVTSKKILHFVERIF